MSALLLALALTASHRFTPQDGQALFEAGNAAYFKGDYAEAAETFQKLSDDGWTSADVEYNLGTARLAEGKVGRAILALSRARRLEPADDDVTANLERARHELVDKVTGSGEQPLAARMAELLPLSQTGWLFLGGWVLLWGALLLRSRVPRLAAPALFAALFLGLCTLALAGLLGVQWYARERLHEAVVVGATVPAHEGPSKESKVSFELHEGTELRVLERQAGFVRVRLANGLEAWALSGDVEEI
jgi:tetratricopeptide (TPR) repeat protein